MYNSNISKIITSLFQTKNTENISALVPNWR
jgi:hypothetical protein